ncbi:DcaP family trimeric outer membrane transporter [Acinetobacter sp. ASP199]|uniref:DcaP family trimeric outer membrane transporter n=1 Tax=unclassified Acinetobacter TaxID=196816 RepID=UPI001F625255|nr:DcaP family trimeric outer membrane transporter [Acinetobacter sp. ASP199]UNT58350.1 DcaP-like protein [Acinetobacter sp. ASP199]
MKIKHLSYTILFASLYATGTHAEQATQAELQQLKSEVAELRAILNQAQPVKQNVQAPVDPKSTPFSNWQSKSGASVNLYGFIRGDMAYQFEGGKNIFNSPHTVALEGSADKHLTEDRFDTTLTTTRIGLDFSTPVDDETLKGKIEIDFRGGDKKDTVRLRHVYMTYGDWLVGQTTSTFLSTETAPEMLDFNTALGGGTTRNPMVRYSGQLSEGNQYFVSLEKGNDENRLPLLATKLKHDLSNGQGYVTARGLVQEVRVRDLDDKTELGWGAALGLRYKLAEPLTLNANYSHVSGDNKILLASSDNSRYLTDQAEIELIDFDAFQIGMTYKINPKLRSTVGYGTLVYDDNNDKANKKLQQGWVNMMYNPVKPITLGVEYVQGERKTMNDQKGDDSRLEMMVRYNF